MVRAFIENAHARVSARLDCFWVYAHDLTGRIHDPYELFLTDICNTEPAGLIITKIEVTHHTQSLLERNPTRFVPGGERMRFDDTGYFYRYVSVKSERSLTLTQCQFQV